MAYKPETELSTVLFANQTDLSGRDPGDPGGLFLRAYSANEEHREGQAFVLKVSAAVNHCTCHLGFAKQEDKLPGFYPASPEL